MIPYKFSQLQDGDVLDLVIEGQIDEESNFPNTQLRGVKTLKLNVENVSFINSAGVRKWILWNRELASAHPDLAQTYVKLPTVLSRQVVSIDGFIDRSAKIESMVIPFYCEGCEKGFKILFEKSTQLLNKSITEIISSGEILEVCPDCGISAEVDGNPQHYLALMTRF